MALIGLPEQGNAGKKIPGEGLTSLCTMQAAQCEAEDEQILSQKCLEIVDGVM